MITEYKPLTYFAKKEKQSLFLAGGIDSAPDWQLEAVLYLYQKYNHMNLAVFNPRRSEKFSTEDYNAREEQVKWEFMHLRYANAILFWFPENAPCTTSLLELGYWLNTSKVFVGVNPGHYKERSIKAQIKLLNESRVGIKIEVQPTLEATIDRSISFLNKGF